MIKPSYSFITFEPVMRVFIFGFYVLLSALQAASAAQTIELEFRAFANFKPLPPQALLGDAGFARYQGFLKAGDCDAARKLLHPKFVARYPQFRNTLVEEGHHTIPYVLWLGVIVLKRYPELSIGLAKRDLDTAASRIGAQGAKPGYFFQGDLDKEPPGWEPGTFWADRDLAILDYYLLAMENYGPAYVALGRLTRRGGIFRFGADVEYYFLRRACLLAVPCAPLAPRLKALSVQLGPGSSQSYSVKNEISYRR